MDLREDAMISQERLREVLDYDAESGEFRYRSRRGHRNAGTIAGTVDPSNGYRKITIDYKHYYAHRLAWLYVHGEFPEHETDHVNGVRTDNRIANLRPVTRAQNSWNHPRNRNNTSGIRGVSLDKQRGLWAAYVNLGVRKIHLGYFDSLDMAAAARQAAELKHFGQFVRAA